MGRAAAVAALLAHGADVNGVWKLGIDSPPWGEEHGLVFNPKYQPTLAPIVMASMQGHIEVVRVLIGAGANVRIQNNLALEHARDNGHRQVLEVLRAEISKTS